VPIDPLSAGLEIVPLVGEQLARFLARNEVGKLLRLVEAEMRQQSLPPGSTELVVAKVSGLRVDPTVAGGLMLWLDGDARAKEGLQARLSELLVFDDLDVDGSVIVGLTLRAIERNLHRAKRDDREASHLEAELLRSEVRDIPERITDRLQGEQSATSSRPMFRAIKALADLRPDQTDVLARLEREDPQGAAALQEALSAGGPSRIADLIETPQSWLENGTAGLWDAAGRLAESAGRLAAAQQAFVRAADHPGVVDASRLLVRAAQVAIARGHQGDSDELLDRARQIGPENAAILLHEARTIDDADEALRLLDGIAAVDDGQAALKELTRAGYLAAREEFGEARTAALEARKLAPTNRGADEMDALLDLIETQRGLGRGNEPVASRMQAAGETFGSLMREASEQERWDIAGMAADRRTTRGIQRHQHVDRARRSMGRRCPGLPRPSFLRCA
jgi:tetratricopeptide (TPR) repeat protein